MQVGLNTTTLLCRNALLCVLILLFLPTILSAQKGGKDKNMKSFFEQSFDTIKAPRNLKILLSFSNQLENKNDGFTYREHAGYGDYTEVSKTIKLRLKVKTIDTTQHEKVGQYFLFKISDSLTKARDKDLNDATLQTIYAQAVDSIYEVWEELYQVEIEKQKHKIEHQVYLYGKGKRYFIITPNASYKVRFPMKFWYYSRSNHLSKPTVVKWLLNMDYWNSETNTHYLLYAI